MQSFVQDELPLSRRTIEDLTILLDITQSDEIAGVDKLFLELVRYRT